MTLAAYREKAKRETRTKKKSYHMCNEHKWNGGVVSNMYVATDTLHRQLETLQNDFNRFMQQPRRHYTSIRSSMYNYSFNFSIFHFRPSAHASSLKCTEFRHILWVKRHVGSINQVPVVFKILPSRIERQCSVRSKPFILLWFVILRPKQRKKETNFLEL